MNIRKKLYMNFGLLLLIVAILCAANVVVVLKEHAARAATAKAFEVAQAGESIRYQMMQNRQLLSNYLLSGSSGEATSLNDGMAKLQELIRKTSDKVSSDAQKTSLSHLSDTERDWENNFARQLVDKRRQVDSGNATVSELQIQYLQLDPASWTSKSAAHVDELERLINNELTEQRKADASTSNWTMFVAILLGVIGIAAGAFIAYKTSASITEPLYQLMLVSREIGETGDLDHQIDIQRSDEIGELGRTFAKMVA